MNSGNIALWRGRDINTMSKAELIEALIEMAQLYDQEIQQHLHQLDVLAGQSGKLKGEMK